VPKPPVIGVATETFEPTAGQLNPAWIMEQRYIRVLADLGALPWIIPLLDGQEETLKSIYARLDGVFLTGGVDVDPACYREPRHPLCGKTDPPRDGVEAQLIRWAIRDRKPLLGVCRGLQMLNVVAGGSLFQDVGAQVPGVIQHDSNVPNDGNASNGLVHQVRVKPASRLRAILGADEIGVNSTHHQAIKELAPGLVPCAWAPDGLIEAIEGEDERGQFLLAVQWHPEVLADTMAPMRQLFQSFLEAASSDRQPRSEC
jgi:putative glutamine amidotransferase